MGKRHNRKRTRSRPRHRDGFHPKVQSHARSDSVDTAFSRQSTMSASFTAPSQYPLTNVPPDHWHKTHASWQDRMQLAQEQEQEQQEREREVETQRLRIFGGLPGDEVSLLEPMLQVVLDLFDGFIDYEDP